MQSGLGYYFAIFWVFAVVPGDFLSRLAGWDWRLGGYYQEVTTPMLGVMVVVNGMIGGLAGCIAFPLSR